MADERERLAVTEIKLGNHEQRIGIIEKKITLLHQDLGDLKSVLVNIKWWLVGVGTFYIAQEIGMMAVIRKMLGI